MILKTQLHITRSVSFFFIFSLSLVFPIALIGHSHYYHLNVLSSILQTLPDRYKLKAKELYEIHGKSVGDIMHELGSMHSDEMRAQGITQDYKHLPCTYNHLHYFLTNRSIVDKSKAKAHEATDFVAILEEKARLGEIQFDWCAGSCGELKNCMWSTRGIVKFYVVPICIFFITDLHSLFRRCFQNSEPARYRILDRVYGWYSWHDVLQSNACHFHHHRR